ncbi:replication initiation negative regulator SeqA [Enterobacteriaceae bacterium LUAb1]
MKTIEIDEELYRYIASHTQHIGESASDILRRMLNVAVGQKTETTAAVTVSQNSMIPTKMDNAPQQDSVSTLQALLLSDTYAEQKRAVNRFLMILSQLYHLDRLAFTDAAESLSGRTRRYFADDQQILLQNGTQTKPQHVPGTPFWVITNTNTGRKRSMIEHIMTSMQFPAELTEKVCGTL